jgi:CBS domain-containing protein
VAQGLIDARSADDVLGAPLLAGIRLPGYLTVRDVMGGRVISVRGDTSLGEAIRLMIAHGIPALPVIAETGEVVGMVSYRELLRYLLPNYVKRVSGGYPAISRAAVRTVSDPESMLVREVMDRSVLCVSDDQTLADVASMMVNKDVDRFPVVQDGVLVGFLTRGDIVRRLFAP